MRFELKKSLVTRAAISGLLLGGMGLSGCVVRERVVEAPPPPPPSGPVVEEDVVTDAPPPDQVEVVGVAPGPDYFWVGGYYGWRGGRYVWYRGHWDRRPHPGAYWVSGHWEHHRRGWFFVGGYWR